MDNPHEIAGTQDHGNREGIRTLGVGAISVLILLTLAVQATISVVIFPVASHVSKTWPFLDYPMYRKAHYPGDRVPQIRVLGIHEDGKEVVIEGSDLGIAHWHYQVFIKALLRGDRKVWRDLVEKYEATHDTRLSELRVVDRGPIFNGTFVQSAPDKVLTNIGLTTFEKEGL